MYLEQRVDILLVEHSEYFEGDKRAVQICTIDIGTAASKLSPFFEEFDVLHNHWVRQGASVFDDAIEGTPKVTVISYLLVYNLYS